MKNERPAQVSPEQKKAKALRAYGQEFVQPHIRDVLAKEGTPELRHWYSERLKALPEIVTEATDVPQFGWERKFSLRDVAAAQLPQDIQEKVAQQEEVGIVEYTEDTARKIHHTFFVGYDKNGQKTVKEIDSTGEQGSAFNVNGLLVKKYKLQEDGTRAKDAEGKDILVQEWWQPIVDQNPEVVKIWTPDGIKEVAVSGFVAILRDQEGRIAVALEQEPGAHSEKHALVRTPVQTSVSKLQAISRGEIPADPLANVLASIVPEGKTFEDLLIEPGIMVSPEAQVDEIRPEPLPYADANRLDSKNLAIEFPPLSNDVIEKLTADGKIFMATPEEIFTLHRARLLNYHAAGMVLDIAIRTIRGNKVA
ncbi:MAG TPA: hypothetical protein VEW42_02045 [Candidatus Eisenbacteria bacterium]|nr:hypothetical protein [Candidatus Eisenbacteria bacterium]